ncbi:MAG: hypothetical protein LW806_12040 [Planctomycetaceae bacterium]|nr:hypothetical protein [Planctomycetaceae bacterium]
MPRNHRVATILVAPLLVASPSAAGMLFDQIGGPGNLPPTGPEGFFRYGSQVFVGEPQFDLAALDDFSLAAGARIDSVATVIAGYGAFSSYGAILGFELRIFASPQAAASGPSNAIAVRTLGPAANYTDFGTGKLVEFALADAIDLAAGSYWMTVQAVNSAPANGQIGVVISDLGDATSFQANPGGGFGIPGNLLARPVNLAYRLGGEIIPAPAALPLMLFGCLACRRRRRGRAGD